MNIPHAIDDIIRYGSDKLYDLHVTSASLLRISTEISQSLLRSLKGVSLAGMDRSLDLWKTSSFDNFNRFRCYNLEGLKTFEADRTNSEIKKLYALPLEERAVTVYDAVLFISERAGAQSFDGEHLIFWISQQREAERLKIFTAHDLRIEALDYLTNSSKFLEASHLAGVTKLHQEASIHAEKVARSEQKLERKADWFIRAAGYAARAQSLKHAHRLMDKSAQIYEEMGDFLSAGNAMSWLREQRIVEGLDNNFLSAYRRTPHFVEKLPLPERNSGKYKSDDIITPRMIEKAIAFFEEGAKHPLTGSSSKIGYDKNSYVRECEYGAKELRKTLEKRKASVKKS